MGDQGDHRRSLLEAYSQAHGDFDRAIMTLSAGGLALSIAFVDNIAKTPVQTGYLLAAWIFFVASLIVILASFLTSQAALRTEIRALDGTIAEPRAPGGGYGVVTLWLNLVSAGSLVMGVGLLVAFAKLNL